MKHMMNELKERASARFTSNNQEQQRLSDELNYINENGGAQALLLISDLVNNLKSEGIRVGTGSGYATCSQLCYGLGITDVNPERWNLPFSRFTRSFKPGNTFTIETTTGGSGKALDFLHAHGANPIEQEYHNSTILNVPFVTDIAYPTLRLRINTNHIIDTIDKLACNLSKSDIPFELDKKTLQLFRDGDTNDIWGFNSTDMRKWLKEFQPESFSDLFLLNALYRPGLLDKLPEVTHNKTTNKIPSTSIEEIDNILQETYGQLLYQEQAIQLEEALSNQPATNQTPAIKQMINIPAKDLFLKGHSIAMTMLSVQLAYFKTHYPEEFKKIIIAVKSE